MDRKDFLASLAITPLIGAGMKLQEFGKITEHFEETERMPVLFVGHGSPMNAIEDNVFSRGMKAAAKGLPKPKAILMVSAHWETKGTFVTAQDNPPTIHDFGGFPKALFDAQYPAPGSKWLANETKETVKNVEVGLDDKWGFDHGCWSVTKNMFPNADIPVVQLSLDYTKPASYHYELGKELAALRRKGVMIIGSGNMVHNFKYMQVPEGDFNKPFALDWAIEANDTFKKLILDNDYKSLYNYQALGKPAQLAVPTPEHYLPMLYAIALREKDESVSFFNDVAVGASFSMTSVIINKA